MVYLCKKIIKNEIFTFLSFKDQLIPNSAWKDFSTNTNYAFDTYGENEEKPPQNGKQKSSRNAAGISQQTTLQMTHTPVKNQHYEGNRGGNRYNGGENR